MRCVHAIPKVNASELNETNWIWNTALRFQAHIHPGAQTSNAPGITKGHTSLDQAYVVYLR